MIKIKISSGHLIVYIMYILNCGTNNASSVVNSWLEVLVFSAFCLFNFAVFSILFLVLAAMTVPWWSLFRLIMLNAWVLLVEFTSNIVWEIDTHHIKHICHIVAVCVHIVHVYKCKMDILKIACHKWMRSWIAYCAWLVTPHGLQ